MMKSSCRHDDDDVSHKVYMPSAYAVRAIEAQTIEAEKRLSANMVKHMARMGKVKHWPTFAGGACQAGDVRRHR